MNNEKLGRGSPKRRMRLGGSRSRAGGLAPAAFLPIDCKRGRQNGADNFGCKEIFINFRGVRLARYKIFY